VQIHIWEKAFSYTRRSIKVCTQSFANFSYFPVVHIYPSSLLFWVTVTILVVEQHRRGMNEETRRFYSVVLFGSYAFSSPPQLSRCSVARYLKSLSIFLPAGRDCLSQLTEGGGRTHKRRHQKSVGLFLYIPFVEQQALSRPSASRTMHRGLNSPERGGGEGGWRNMDTGGGGGVRE
jgi:hypothetical protein